MFFYIPGMCNPSGPNKFPDSVLAEKSFKCINFPRVSGNLNEDGFFTGINNRCPEDLGDL